MKFKIEFSIGNIYEQKSILGAFLGVNEAV